jgi:hypothetical protein
MRFAANVVGPDGRASSKRPKLPGNFIRMDDKETFRLYFENDWDVDGTVKFVYDGVNNQLVYETELEAHGICKTQQLFTYERTKKGEGRLLEIMFSLNDIEGDPYEEKLMIINNDYNPNGSAVQYGQVDEGDDVVVGICTDRALDPDRDKRVN